MSALLLFAIGTTERVDAHHRIESVKARVRFLATSWFLRGTWGPNEDKYLVEISLARKGSPFLAQLVDKYQNESPSLPAEALRSEVGIMFHLIRDPNCDIPFGQMALRTAPEDLMATQLIKLHYQPKLSHQPKSNEILPCYRVLRR